MDRWHPSCHTKYLNGRNCIWFLKFLIPKLIINKTIDGIDELLDSVDLSTYGLERVKLNVYIGLDSSETEIEPPNANPRGATVAMKKRTRWI
jgi:type I restriction enzyme, R subunit